MATTTTYSLQGRYIFPIDRPPLRDGWITVSEGRIVSVGHAPAGDRRNLGEVAILPAIINAHAHLEFSNLNRPLGDPGIPFTQWIREVVRWRRAAIEQSEGADWRSDAIRCGIGECSLGGAVTVGEIMTLPWAEGDRRYEGMQGVKFLELLGLADGHHEELLGAAHNYVAASQGNRWPLHPGLSPHAPYTVSPKLVESVAAFSASTRTPVALHLAETQEELELLRSGSGPFRELLDDLGAWQSDVIPRESTPLDYLKLLARADRSLIVHGNYLRQEEIEFAGQQRERMSVIYCPRTHAYFDHACYPLQKMLHHGVNLAFGTDSRASNPDLNMLSEVRFAAQQHPDISRETILGMATINAARALGMDAIVGTLTPGKRADFIVVPISSSVSADPHDLLLDSAQRVRQLFRSGEPILAASDVAGE